MRGDSHWAVVRVAGAHAEASDRLEGGVGDRDTVGPQRQCPGEVGRFAQTSRDDQRDIGGVAGIEVSPRPRQSRQSGYGNIVAEDQRGRAGTASAAVEDEVVDADSQGGIDVLFDVLGGESEADRDASRRCAHLLGELSEVGCRTSRPLHDLVAARRARAL